MSIAPINSNENLQSANSGNSGVFSSKSVGGFEALFAMLFKGIPMESGAVDGKSGLGGLLGEAQVLDGGAKQNVLSLTDLSAKMSLLGADIDGEGEDFATILNGILGGSGDGIDGVTVNPDGKFSAILGELQVTISQLKSAEMDISQINGVNELAQAFTALGMSPEAALAKAQRTVAALEAMQARLGVGLVNDRGAANNGSIGNGEDILDMFLRYIADGGKSSSQSAISISEYKLHIKQAVAKFEASTIMSAEEISMNVLSGKDLWNSSVNPMALTEAGLDGKPIKGLPADIITAKGALFDGIATGDKALGAKELAARIAALGSGKALSSGAGANASVGAGGSANVNGLAGSNSAGIGEEILATALSKNSAKAIADTNNALQSTLQNKVGQVVSEQAVKAENSLVASKNIEDATAKKVGAVNNNEIYSNKVDGDKILAAPAGKALFSWRPEGQAAVGNAGQLAVGQQMTGQVAGQGVEQVGNGVIVDTLSGKEFIADDFSKAIDEVAEESLRLKINQHGRVAMERTSMQAMAKQADIATQVNVQIRKMVANGGGKVRILMNPPELGKLEIELNIKNGAVRGVIVVQNIEVAEQLARDLRNLQQGLADSGLELDKNGIDFILKEDVTDEQLADNNSESSQDGQSSELNDETEFGEDMNGKSQNVAWVNPDNLVDVSI